MPILSSVGSASTVGFRVPSIGGGKSLKTVSPDIGTTTWTAPTGVTSLASLYGVGQDAAWDDVTVFGSTNPVYYGGGTLHGPTLTYDDVNALMDVAVSTANEATTNEFGASGTLFTFTFHWDSSSSQWYVRTFAQTLTLYRTGTLVNPYSGMTGTITPGSTNFFMPTGGTLYNLYGGNDGAAFGYTFEGGSVYTYEAYPRVYYNVAVTPGTTYTINNIRDISFSYYE